LICKEHVNYLEVSYLAHPYWSELHKQDFHVLYGFALRDVRQISLDPIKRRKSLGLSKTDTISTLASHSVQSQGLQVLSSNRGRHDPEWPSGLCSEIHCALSRCCTSKQATGGTTTGEFERAGCKRGKGDLDCVFQFEHAGQLDGVDGFQQITV
jgi:hypothetical protein